VFKIEGRARSAEYVHYVVQSYHQAITSVLDGTYSRSMIDGWMEKLSLVFNRGFWNGYYLGQRLGEWSEAYGSVAKKKKIYAGRVTNYFSKIKVAEITVEACAVKSDDTLLIIGPTTGYMEIPLDELRNVGGDPVEILDKAVGSIKVPERVRRADKVFVWR
jgi:putative protease